MSKGEFTGTLKVCADILWSSGSYLRVFFLLSVVLDVLVVAFSVAAPSILKHLIDSYNGGASGSGLSILGVGYGLTWLAAEILLRIKAVVGVIFIEEVKKQASSRFCLSTIFEEKETPDLSPGVFSTKLTQINSAVPIFLDGLVGQVFPLVVRLLFSVSVLFQFVPQIYSIALIVTVGSFAGVSLMTFNVIGDKQRVANKASQLTVGLILDVFKNREVIIAHANEANEISRMNDSLSRSKGAIVSTVNAQQVISAAQIAILGVGLTAITALSAYDLANKSITLGDFVQINAYLLQFVIPVSYFGMVISGIKRAVVTLGENCQFLRKSSTDFESTSSFRSDSSPQIDFSGVTIRDLAGECILQDVSFSIEAGRSLAIVGPSGAGKTTLLKVLVGLHKPDDGEIRYGDDVLSSTNIRKWREMIGYVPQDDSLFDRDVSQNVLPSSCCEDDVEFYLKVVGLDLNDRKDSVFTSAQLLSGGERQRVSLARALARKAKVIIFDEPTSSLDVDSKKIIAQVLFDMLDASATRIIATHDLREAMKADDIIVLEGGRVSARGSHSNLMKRAGWYQRQWFQLHQVIHSDEH